MSTTTAPKLATDVTPTRDAIDVLEWIAEADNNLDVLPWPNARGARRNMTIREVVAAAREEHTKALTQLGVRFFEEDIIETFRDALQRAHHNDWDMETVSEAAHICAGALWDLKLARRGEGL